jgi:hypothetical protein
MGESFPIIWFSVSVRRLTFTGSSVMNERDIIALVSTISWMYSLHRESRPQFEMVVYRYLMLLNHFR